MTRYSRLSTSLLKATALSGLLTLATLSAAHAASITVSPSAAGLSTAPNFTFNGIRFSDFSSVNLTSSGSGFNFTETGYLPVASFDPGNFTPPGLNGSLGATPYGLYLAFTASGSLTALPGNILSGSFSSINYTLMGDPGFNDTFNHFTPTHQVFCVGCAGDTTLANGTLSGFGANNAVIVNANASKPLPSAFANLLFNGTSSTFFVAPTAPFTLDLDTQFSNTSTVTNRYTTNLPPGVNEVVTIGTTSNQGGSGTGQFSNIPEPTTMLILGSGMLGLGMVRRLRNRT